MILARLSLRLVALSLVVCSPVDAQAVTGAIAGRALSPDGTPAAGVVVTAGGGSILGERTVTSNDAGRFLLPVLPAGTYEIDVRGVGYAPLRVTGVTVVLGGTTSLGDLRLTQQTIALPEIVVSAARPRIDPTTTANATTLDSATFLALPTDRNFRALMPLVPEADPSPYGDGTNVAGATGLENGYFADGINITDPDQGDGSLDLPYNFVREVRVTTGGYEAEYGRTQGGLVNVVTNSGGNDFHGQLLGFYTGNVLRAAPRWGTGQSRIATFSQYDAGFSLGGPIRRDRLWIYAAYNPTFETRDASFPGIQTQPDTRTLHLFAGKLTGRLGPATDVTVTLLGDPSIRDFVGPIVLAPLASIRDPRAVLGRETWGGVATALQVRHQVDEHIVLTGSLARFGRSGEQVPRAGPVTDMVALARLDDDVTNETSGNWGLSGSTRITRTSGQASLVLLATGHTIKLGAEYEDNAIRNDARLSYATKLSDTAYFWIREVLHSNAHNDVPALYVQDAWEVDRRLLVNFGVRWEGQFMAGDTGVARWIAPELAPRLGVVFEPGTLGRQKVFGSYGRFFEEIPLEAPGVWAGLNTLIVTAYRQNPLADTSGGVVQVYSAGAGTAPDRSLKGQQYDEWSLGYERLLGNAYRIAVQGTYRTLRWVVEDGAPDPASAFIMGNPGRGAMAYLPRARRDYQALEVTLERAGPGPLVFWVSYVLSRSWGNYTGVYATDIETALSNAGPQFDFPDETINGTGLLPNDHRHVGKLVGSYRFPDGLTVGTSALLSSGAPLSEYGTSVAGPPWWTFIRPRGTAGRTPAIWDVDLRLAWDAPVARGSRIKPRVLLDVFNVGDQRKPLTFDQLHYESSDRSAVNPNYGAVTSYQAPLHARVGVVLNF
jgi:carboxypeptidase family protein